MHIFMYYMMLLYMSTLCNVQIRVIIYTSSSIYHFFIIKTYKILSSRFVEICNTLLLSVAIPLYCTSELISLI